MVQNGSLKIVGMILTFDLKKRLRVYTNPLSDSSVNVSVCQIRKTEEIYDPEFF